MARANDVRELKARCAVKTLDGAYMTRLNKVPTGSDSDPTDSIQLGCHRRSVLSCEVSLESEFSWPIMCNFLSMPTPAAEATEAEVIFHARKPLWSRRGSFPPRGSEAL